MTFGNMRINCKMLYSICFLNNIALFDFAFHGASIFYKQAFCQISYAISFGRFRFCLKFKETVQSNVKKEGKRRIQKKDDNNPNMFKRNAVIWLDVMPNYSMSYDNAIRTNSGYFKPYPFLKSSLLKNKQLLQNLILLNMCQVH